MTPTVFCSSSIVTLTLSLVSLTISAALSQQIGYTFLPCVLSGLSYAPQYLLRNSGSLDKNCILASDVDSVILPITACGGDGALSFARISENRVIF